MARKRGTDKQETDDESLPCIIGVGSLHNVSDRPVKQKPKRQIGFVRSDKLSTPKGKVVTKRNK